MNASSQLYASAVRVTHWTEGLSGFVHDGNDKSFRYRSNLGRLTHRQSLN